MITKITDEVRAAAYRVRQATFPDPALVVAGGALQDSYKTFAEHCTSDVRELLDAHLRDVEREQNGTWNATPDLFTWLVQLVMLEDGLNPDLAQAGFQVLRKVGKQVFERARHHAELVIAVMEHLRGVGSDLVSSSQKREMLRQVGEVRDAAWLVDIQLALLATLVFRSVDRAEAGKGRPDVPGDVLGWGPTVLKEAQYALRSRHLVHGAVHRMAANLELRTEKEAERWRDAATQLDDPWRRVVDRHTYRQLSAPETEDQPAETDGQPAGSADSHRNRLMLQLARLLTEVGLSRGDSDHPEQNVAEYLAEDSLLDAHVGLLITIYETNIPRIRKCRKCDYILIYDNICPRCDMKPGNDGGDLIFALHRVASDGSPIFDRGVPPSWAVAAAREMIHAAVLATVMLGAAGTSGWLRSRFRTFGSDKRLTWNIGGAVWPEFVDWEEHPTQQVEKFVSLLRLALEGWLRAAQVEPSVTVQ